MNLVDFFMRGFDASTEDQIFQMSFCSFNVTRNQPHGEIICSHALSTGFHLWINMLRLLVVFALRIGYKELVNSGTLAHSCSSYNHNVIVVDLAISDTLLDSSFMSGGHDCMTSAGKSLLVQ